MPRPGTPPPDTGVRRPSPSRRSATLLPPFARWWSPTGAAAVALLLLLAAATTGPPPLAASRLTVASPRARQLPPQLALKLRLLTPIRFPPIPLPPYPAPRNTSLPSPGHSGSPGSSVAASATMAAALARPSLPAGPWVWTHTQRTQAARDVGSPSPGVPSWWTAPEWGDERTRRLPRQRSPTPTPTPSTPAPPLGGPAGPALFFSDLEARVLPELVHATAAAPTCAAQCVPGLNASVPPTTQMDFVANLFHLLPRVSPPLPPFGSLAPLRCQAEDLRCSPPFSEGFEARVPPASPAPAIEPLRGPRYETLQLPSSP